MDDALRLEIIDTTDHHSDVNINDWLVQNGYAEAAPEPHNSKVHVIVACLYQLGPTREPDG